ncbi:MAG: PD-(D/E)XK nuclease family protein [Elusimicrobia bacterium]|nr:PD-(D/E)XK nuclease family protein [Elusimicrobiota bacterium]
MRRKPAGQPPGDEGTPPLPGLGSSARLPAGPAPEPAAHIESDTSRKFSPSKLDTYKDCPRRYRFRYVDGLRRRVETAETLLGSCVHRALEWLYAGIIHGRESSLDETLAVFDQAWTAGWSDAVLNRHKEYGPQHHQAAGRDCIRNYFQAYAPFRQDATLAVEKRVGFPLSCDGEEVRIEGLVDRLSRTGPGAYEVHDYKTTATLPGQAELDQDWQLAIYDISVRESWPDAREVALVWHFVRFGQTMRSRRTDQQRRLLREEIAALVARIKRDHVFAPRRGPLCDWCEYRGICPAWKAPAEASALAREYAVLDGRRRDLREKLHDLEVQARQLEDEIVKQAAACQVERLTCAEGDVFVSFKDDYHVPTRTHAPELYEAIEDRLRETPLWKRAAHIDLHRLLQGYDRGDWDEASARLIAEVVAGCAHIQRIRKATVRLHRKKEEEEPE